MAKYLNVPFKLRKISQTSYGITFPRVISDMLHLTDRDSFYINTSGNLITLVKSGNWTKY